MSEAECTVLIPTYNRRETLLRCLDHVEAECDSGALVQVVVVDDGSTDGTVGAVRSGSWPRLHALDVVSQPNAGPAAARNRGLALAAAPLTLFINDDALLQPGAVRAHLDAHREHPGSMVLGSFDFVPEMAATPLGRMLTETTHLFSHSLLLDGDVLLGDLAATCNLSVPTVAAQRAMFDETFTFAAEDVDFAKRLEADGLVLRYVEAARALHDHHLTLDDMARMAELRGVGAARLALKHGVPDRMLRDVRTVAAVADEVRSAVTASVDQLRIALEHSDTSSNEPFPERCYGALADVFRLGNLMGYLAEPRLALLAGAGR